LKKAAGLKEKPAPKQAQSSQQQQQQQQQQQPKDSLKAADLVKTGTPETVNKLTSNLKSSLKISADLSSPINPFSVSAGSESVSFETASETLKLNRKKKEKSVDDDSSEDLQPKYSKLFCHFDKFKRDYSITERYALDNPQAHPAFIKMGIQTAHDLINGSNARCLAFLNAFREFLTDYKGPRKDGKTISKDLESELKPNIKYARFYSKFQLTKLYTLKLT
jgi:translation initiation factor eIF-2B subunit delta